ncbi:hypothetical protein, conserved [Babesia bigemina]|uniref:RAP domain-containing protein n=1 Tax=Babesia bigemina TaxID=5866 RepID=A0A061D4H3_BABBI|nr:hypothetical protein, conserved [Babesia bigemina]CDR95478.1 hypothetical protein, conserved [Babesia bigemina]|eukprot:XP_012767664.1 hypothetical protein, conserved [Babesia bigemina]
MITRKAMCRRAWRGGCHASALATRRYSGLANSVSLEVARACSLWARREPRVVAGKNSAGSDIMLLAARHLGLPDSEQLWRLSPQSRQGRLPSVVSHTKIVYQDAVAGDRDGQHNDIWLGHARYRSYIALTMHGPSGVGGLDWWAGLGDKAATLEAGECVDSLMRSDATSGEGVNHAEGDPTSRTDTTIFVYPYSRKSSQLIVETLNKHRKGLTETDIRSLIYLCGSTGSSRALRFLGQLIREQCRGKETASAIHRVEEHAWPWMNHGSMDNVAQIGVPVVLDALASAAIIQYTFEKESAVFDYIGSQLQKLDAKIKEEGAAVADEVKALDEAVLSRVVNLLVLKRNLSQFNSDHIRVFSDFICDRLHRIDPRSVANIAFSLGHSKHLDEFWMFMMAKRIQDSPHEFGPDEVAAIMDAYSNACLEDHEFYATLCKQVADNFEHHNLQHLTVILRALARVRVRDEWLLENTLNRLQAHLKERENLSDDKGTGRELAYMTANCVVAAGDLGYVGNCNFDVMWRLLTTRIRDSSFDICAINWLPLAAMTFASRTTLQTFMPVWLRHVLHTIQKLRSKTFVLTIQRRHHLVRHVFRLGILPPQLLPRHAQSILDDICDREYVTGKVPEEYVPESSTFHLEVCACLRALDVAHQREINIVPFVMDIVVPPKVRNHANAQTYAHRKSTASSRHKYAKHTDCLTRSEAGIPTNSAPPGSDSSTHDTHPTTANASRKSTSTTKTMDEIESYRNRHHQAYLARKSADEKAQARETHSQRPAPAADCGITPPAQQPHQTVGYGEQPVVKGEIPQGYDYMDYEGDPMYESSVALARRLQEELNGPQPQRDEVRPPDSVYQERMISSENEDDDLQAAIAKSLIDM